MKYALNQILTDPYGFTGSVDAIFVNFEAAVNCNIVNDPWFSQQEKKPSTRDQVFYSLVGPNRMGAVLVGENEAREG